MTSDANHHIIFFVHRTTIEIDDKMLRVLKSICTNEGRKFKHLVLELIRYGLQVRQEQRSTTSARGLSIWHTGKGALPKGIDPADRSTYHHELERPLP